MAEGDHAQQLSQQGLLAERAAALQQLVRAVPQEGSEVWSTNIVDARVDLLTGKQIKKKKTKVQKYVHIR